eukprot:TRINITY_DN3740_c5_g1_i1.p1 TRINITY_DN3740_c5_g1~~TRINITY_DN3740_c5_g1_i1.p1  ORF type:complete len:693 (+),score=236.44 TRINITY_DN3740_c5_g1_i1:108-2186(+)
MGWPLLLVAGAVGAATPSVTATLSLSGTATVSLRGTVTRTATVSGTYEQTATATDTRTDTAARTSTASATGTLPSETASVTHSLSSTGSASQTVRPATVTTTFTVTLASATLSASGSGTRTRTATADATASRTVTATATVPTATATETGTATRSATGTVTATLPSSTATFTMPTATATGTFTMPTESETGTVTLTATRSRSISVTLSSDAVDDSAPEEGAAPQRVSAAEDDDEIEGWVWLVIGIAGGLCVAVAVASVYLCVRRSDPAAGGGEKADARAAAPQQPAAQSAAAGGRGEWAVGDRVEARAAGTDDWLTGTVTQCDAGAKKQGGVVVWVQPDGWGASSTFAEVRKPGGAASPMPDAKPESAPAAQVVTAPASSPRTGKSKKVHLWELREQPVEQGDVKEVWAALLAPPAPVLPPAETAMSAVDASALRVQMEDLKNEVRSMRKILSDPPSPTTAVAGPQTSAFGGDPAASTSSAPVDASYWPSRPPPPVRALPPGSPVASRGAPPPAAHKAPPAGRGSVRSPAAAVAAALAEGSAASSPYGGSPRHGHPPPPPPIAGSVGGAAGTWVYDEGKRYSIAPDGAGGLRFVEQVPGGVLSGPLLRSSDVPPPRGFGAQWAVPLLMHRAGKRVPEQAGTVWLRVCDSTSMQSAFMADRSREMLVNTAVRMEAGEWEAEGASPVPKHVAAAM